MHVCVHSNRGGHCLTSIPSPIAGVSLIKGAQAALFVWLALGVPIMGTFGAAHAATDCPSLVSVGPNTSTEHHQPRLRTDTRIAQTVAFVLDGDTIILGNRQRVRLIGIDAPERARRRPAHPAEPFAEAATKALRELLPVDSRIYLAPDITQRDRFGRTLAYVFTEAGVDVQKAMLRRGLAKTLVIPPRKLAIECYSDAENEARAHRRGLWLTSPAK